MGQKIIKVSSDPSNALTGEMWYNSTTGSLRGLSVLQAWVSAAPINNALYQEDPVRSKIVRNPDPVGEDEQRKKI